MFELIVVQIADTWSTVRHGKSSVFIAKLDEMMAAETWLLLVPLITTATIGGVDAAVQRLAHKAANDIKSPNNS